MLRSSVSSYSHLLLGCTVPAFLLCATPMRATAADVPLSCTSTVARIVSMQGLVEIRRAGRQEWASVTRLDTPVCQGDTVHAGPRSRAALVILPEKFVRLDQNSTVSISIDGDETVVEFFQDETTPKDACGAGYFITRFPRKFKVRTPFVNAAVEGTEFLVSMSCTATSVAVFEGKVSAETLLANAERFILSTGETISAGPGEPPAIKLVVKPVDAVQWALYYPPLSTAGPGVGPDQQCDQPAPDERGRCLMVRAEQRLRLGRVDEAQGDIDASLRLVPENSDAEALLSSIGVAKNDTQRALALAQHATQLDAVNPRAWIALSYAQQATFKLEDALNSAERAAELEPRSSIALTRVAELMMSLGKIRAAERAAHAAVDANPSDSRAYTILGFVYLAQIDVNKARTDFETAIAIDSSDPLPRLGLGLAIIRSGNLSAGREQLEIAVSLDPTNSLMRSYVGKAYYEENTPARDKLATAQYGIARQLDPKDPTPWFYDAILKQAQNRPAEALEDIQKSISLNNDRGVFRSRLLLDEDLAARSVKQASIYRSLGFEELAEVEAYSALDIDPTNFSAHRLLADSFLLRSRLEIARVSETLQAQVWQPLNLAPAEPLLLDEEPLILRGATPANASPSDFDQLFVRDGLRLQASGLVGTQQTAGDQIVVSGLAGRLSASLSQMHYETNGYQENLGLNKNLYDAFVQVQPAFGTSLFAEARHTDKNEGDLTQTFFGEPNSIRFLQDRDLYRIGFRQDLLPSWSVAGQVSYQNAEDTTEVPAGSPFFNQQLNEVFGELQTIYRTPRWYLMLGGGNYRSTGTQEFFGSKSDVESNAENVYSYFAWEPFPVRLKLILGVSEDQLDSPFFPGVTIRQTNPKFGLVWLPWPSTTIRAAWFRVLRRPLIAEQTIEPTQVAGFNQFFDDSLGTDVTRMGLAVDQRFSPRLYAGIEISKRNLRVPQPFTDPLETFSWSEEESSGYFYWVLNPRLTALTGYSYERFTQDPLFNDGFTNLKTLKVPLGVRLFWPQPEVALRMTMTHVDQSGTFGDAFSGFQDGSSRFWLADASLSLNLPRRLGIVTLEGRNLFNQQFKYQETDIRTPTLARQRTVFLRVTLSFQ